ncbi:unnamed protein product [Linum tenue]|uniref:Uncharacterized protein n=1 Tax=Linum tenue TaxID=586396 RepID=A0AAV0HYG3_9ROSI|nr:unnamed protein product [Linum tenue]
MRGKGNQNHLEKDEYKDEDLVAAGSRKDGPSSNISTTNSNTTSNNRDGKNSDKVSAMRSKHSVTEQRRRSKIKKVYFIYLGNLFLIVIRREIQHPFYKRAGVPRKFDENNIGVTPTMLATAHNTPAEPDPSQDAACNKVVDHQQPDIANKGFPPPIRRLHTTMPLQQSYSDPQSSEYPVSGDSLNQAEELSIEGGTISISSAYTEGLLNALTQALQTAGIDLSQANMSVQIDLGKRNNRGLASGTSANKNPAANHQTAIHLRDVTGARESGHVQKRLKT